jgi:micrococcal nuclease
MAWTSKERASVTATTQGEADERSGILVSMRVTRTLTLACAALLALVACQPPVGLRTPPPTPPTTPPPTPTATPSPTAASSPSPTVTPPPSAPTTPTPGPTFRPTTVPLAPTGPTQQAHVVRVVDGDTIRVRIDGQEHSLRYIGIDTPETVHPSRPVEWMGREASQANRQLVDGRTVVLEKDVSETDRFGRLLRYVWLPELDGFLLVNLELVRLGFAQVSTYPPDVKHTELLLGAQRAAREAGLGLWGEPVDRPTAGAPGGPGSCDPSYPGGCIPPPPPDLDCADISQRGFTVLPPDPHRFDGDHDGIGCESG